MLSLANITTLSIREQAARAIRNGIITGEIRPGEMYSVPMLAERLGVSATPVREAMLDLAGEGLVVAVRNRGYRVIELTEDDLDEILSIRQLLEVPTTGDVAEYHDEADLPQLKELAARLPKLARSGDYQAYLRADQEFHLSMIGMARNRRLVDLVEKLRNQTRFFDVAQLVAARRLTQSADEHLEMVRAIEQRDRATAEKVAFQHLQTARRAWRDSQVPTK